MPAIEIARTIANIVQRQAVQYHTARNLISFALPASPDSQAAVDMNRITVRPSAGAGMLFGRDEGRGVHLAGIFRSARQLRV